MKNLLSAGSFLADRRGAILGTADGGDGGEDVLLPESKVSTDGLVF